MKYILLLVTMITTFISQISNATDLNAHNYHFNLPGKWEVSKSNEGTTYQAELKPDSKNKIQPRALIVSVYEPSSRKEGFQMMADMRVFLEKFGEDNNLTKMKDTQNYKSKRGIPYSAIEYSSKDGNFFIGITMGSNAGIVMITYEGIGNSQIGLAEVKTILDAMTIDAPKGMKEAGNH